MKFYGATNTGLVRTVNEDSFAVLELARNACLLVVCDGMGGLSYGDKASKIAVETFVSKIRTAVTPFIYRDELSNFNESRVSSALGNAISCANESVISSAAEIKDFSGVMGSTLVGILIVDSVAYVVNVGDSRAYAAYGKQLMQITKDHSYVRLLVDDGLITEEEALTHPKRNVITRAIGISPEVNADLFKVNLSRGCRLMLCSDGLSGFADIKDIGMTMLSDASVEDVCNELITHALAAGGGDNVTVVVCDF